MIYVPILLAMVAVVLAHFYADLDPRIFFIDPVAEFNAPMYIGFLSNLGVLIWCTAAVVCLFSGWIIWKQYGKTELSFFLVCAGLISSLLMFDDLYLLHEEVFPDHLRVPQKLVIATYGGLVLVFLFRFRKMILETDFLLLVIAFGFFACSVFVDLFVTPEEFQVFGIPGRDLVEDGFKFFGIATWGFYFVRTSFQKILPMIGTPPSQITSA